MATPRTAGPNELLSIEKVAREGDDVFPALAQQRHLRVHTVEAIIDRVCVCPSPGCAL
jgi:hypothetical protein